MMIALVIIGLLVIVAGALMVAIARNWIVWLGFALVCAGCLELVGLGIWQAIH